MSTANLNDMATLATDADFGSRVLMSLIQYCTTTIPAEAISGTTVQLHVARKQYAAAILNNPTFYKPLFVNAVAANQIVANDATVNGTLVSSTQTTTTVATAALLCTDTDINNAVAAAFNAFVSNI